MDFKRNIRPALATLMVSVSLAIVFVPSLALGQQPIAAPVEVPAAEPDSLELQWKHARDEASGPRVPDHVPMRIIALVAGGAWLWYELVRQRLVPRRRRVRRN